MEWDTDGKKRENRNNDAAEKESTAAAGSSRRRKFWIMLLAIAVDGAVFVVLMRYFFNHSAGFKNLFAASGNEALGEAGPGAEAAAAERTRITALISMYIFSVITVLQFVALAVGVYVVQGIRISADSAALKLKQLENAEVFFDIPLYVGLFGTVSAFLVMTFSPQSSRLIAYSSTLIGIIFSLVLRLSLQYPLRKRLIAVKGSDDK
ncbi:MAG: hypothetical protein J6Y54_03885 [Lentisphaeria bacterium]|nr:hypothetical protein [Lentisphaeria bacterium]